MEKAKKQITYFLEIRLRDDLGIMRELETLPYTSLYNFAEQITDAFGFYFDHCFGYYDVITEHGYLDEVTQQYELFADLDREEGILPQDAGVERVPLNRLWKKPGDTWYFLFDYGDTRIFVITLKKIGTKIPGLIYPRLVSKTGIAPEQYTLSQEDFEHEEAMKDDLAQDDDEGEAIH